MRMPREPFTFLLLACTAMAGCQATFSGRVVNAETGTPVPSAWVWVQKTGDTGFPMYKPRCERLDIVRTDANGRFNVPVTMGAKTGVQAFASGYARDFRLAAVTEINGRSFVESNVRSVVSTPWIVKGNMTVTVPSSGPPTPQQVADAYPNLPLSVAADDGLPLYPLWPVHAETPRRFWGDLPSSCGADQAAYIEATQELRDALQDCRSSGCARW